jgi:hypothetical protein
MSLEEARHATYHRFIEAWTRRNLAAVDDLFTANAVYHVPPFPDLPGTAALKEFILSFNRAFPEDLGVVFDEELGREDVTVHRWTVSGTFAGASPLLPVPPTGRRTVATGCHILHWSGDRCVEAWHFGDWLGWLQRAGVLPPLG